LEDPQAAAVTKISPTGTTMEMVTITNTMVTVTMAILVTVMATSKMVTATLEAITAAVSLKAIAAWKNILRMAEMT